MAKPITATSIKKRRGRPALYEESRGKGAPQIGLRLPPTELAALDAWIRQQPEPRPSRPVAIRRLVGLGLTVKHKRKQAAAAGAARAKELAARAIDKMSDGGASPDDQAYRKRRLLKGPEEFSDARVDRAKVRP